MEVYLIDGTFELFRAYFAMPSLKGEDGGEVGATRGLLRSLASLLRVKKVTHVACAFDHVIESFRNDLFPGYKTGEGIDPDLYRQFSLAEDAVRALGVTVWPMVEFEADDALAAAAWRFAKDKKVEKIYICSPDKDLAQCVQGTRVVLYNRIQEKFFDEAAVTEKFGIPPAAIPDWLALVGDSADGIPGVPRFGAKTAAQILQRYGSLEKIPRQSPWDIKVRGGEQLAAIFRERYKDALLYKKLATLRSDVPLVEDLAAIAWQGADRKELTRVCQELQENDLLNRVSRWR